MVRGIERSDIFLDEDDHDNFVTRFSQLLIDTGTTCYAWALIPNHCHFLLKCNSGGLARFMRRLLTGHAGYFNRRHNRSGHLFQNRYKSIVCEEEPYLLELVRYIHLNPIRAGLVSQLEALERFPWSGHTVVLGNRKMEGQSVDTVLSMFGKRLKSARENYRQFIADGVSMGRRPELVGGGLRRSQKNIFDSGDLENHDDRVLGSGDFVDELQREYPFGPGQKSRMPLDTLLDQISNRYDLTKDQIKRRGRGNSVSDARALFCYLAIEELGATGADVSRFMAVGSSSVSRAVRRGEKLLLSEKNIKVWFKALKQ